MTAIKAVRDYLTSELGPYFPLRCGSPGAICGGARLGIGAPWPYDDMDTSAWCGRARCGAARCGRIVRNNAVFAGMVPAMTAHHITMALEELPGDRADPRQAYAEAYDNPAFTLHIIGDRLDWITALAEFLHGMDMGQHIETEDGVLNGIRILPYDIKERPKRPRYDVQLHIDAEYIRDSEPLEATE